MISVEEARDLIDFGARIKSASRAQEQLEGAVALHNILETRGVAYLADEVGFGKTYVALGALALFRRRHPDFRVLVIAPRDNIQRKWIKEFTNFVSHNVRPALRHAWGDPARERTPCSNLGDLLSLVDTSGEQEFFARMTSFSLPLGDTPDSWKVARERWHERLPRLDRDAFDVSSKHACKSSIALAICTALPVFDLVIVDEAHNLKHGYEGRTSARNTVLAEAFGRARLSTEQKRRFPGYGPRASRVLFLSATPVEDTYAQLWNQLDVFDKAGGYEPLRRADLQDSERRTVAAEFLVRRVTSMRVAGKPLTKNLYRREWREGGLQTHDQPIAITEERQKLIVALVQKKVSELLSGREFNNSFQIGMLASFESFLETAKLRKTDAHEDDEAVDGPFDGHEQNRSVSDRERDGVDVGALNRLAADYRRRFGAEMPHPKMDAVVAGLADAWNTGRKTLVFVRRIASVAELKRKLDERYDQWLFALLRARLAPALRADIEDIIARYREANLASRHVESVSTVYGEDDISNEGGEDTFFAYFFRGQSAGDLYSGAYLQNQFRRASDRFSLFFADNDVMVLLNAAEGSVGAAFAFACGLAPDEAHRRLCEESRCYLSDAARAPLQARFEAAQAAALAMLRDHGADPELRRRSDLVCQAKYAARRHQSPSPAECRDAPAMLERTTFFTRLREARFRRLRDAIWPVAQGAGETSAESVREQMLRATLLSAAARLGHAFIDLYLSVIEKHTSLRRKASPPNVASVADVADGSAEAREEDNDDTDSDHDPVGAFLQCLERQRTVALRDRSWGAFDELREIAQNFELILDVNLAGTAEKTTTEKTVDLAARRIVSLLSQQQPVGGIRGGNVNRRLIQQFRMPGYPFVLVATDVLQEGEDLHTFCSSVMHYGIAWTPSSMEQRTGRIDRVRSQTDRRLASLTAPMQPEDRLQVYFPYLPDTVEVLQVDRVLERMNTFLHLMHAGLVVPDLDEQHIDITREFAAPRRRVEAVGGVLRSAFPLPDWALPGKAAAFVEADPMVVMRERFAKLRVGVLGGLCIDWAGETPRGDLLGTAMLGNGRVQPFSLQLRTDHGDAFVRCITALGRAESRAGLDKIAQRVEATSLRLVASATPVDLVFDLTAEDDVLLGDGAFDSERVGLLLRRVLPLADFLEHARFGGKDDLLTTVLAEQLVRDVP
ncbi:DEAD/DEAH box helicase [Tahibacter sp.]|uniref:DEAD/DEAH box helicase n=1 Tax=Tahibacter sp. TaxID=2056211 RepID=UPI0028C45197|nr:DEAD/DEAH box helicase [Tahibacter sp.]